MLTMICLLYKGRRAADGVRTAGGRTQGLKTIITWLTCLEYLIIYITEIKREVSMHQRSARSPILMCLSVFYLQPSAYVCVSTCLYVCVCVIPIDSPTGRCSLTEIGPTLKPSLSFIYRPLSSPALVCLSLSVSLF